MNLKGDFERHDQEIAPSIFFNRFVDMYYGRIPPHLYPRVDTVSISKEARRRLEEEQVSDEVVHVEIEEQEEEDYSFDYFLLFVIMSGCFAFGFVFGTILAYI